MRGIIIILIIKLGFIVLNFLRFDMKDLNIGVIKVNVKKLNIIVGIFVKIFNIGLIMCCVWLFVYLFK